jgi:hypothetical protein
VARYTSANPWASGTRAGAEARDFDQTIATPRGLSDSYATLLDGVTDEDLRGEMTGFDGTPVSRGSFLVNLVLCGHAAYRMQLFLYLKACGREELNTINLWRGVDGAMATA